MSEPTVILSQPPPPTRAEMLRIFRPFTLVKKLAYDRLRVRPPRLALLRARSTVAVRSARPRRTTRTASADPEPSPSSPGLTPARGAGVAWSGALAKEER